MQELLDLPVDDITEAAVQCVLSDRAALIGGHHADRSVPLIEDRLMLSGLAGRSASVRASGSGMGVLELEGDADAAARGIGEQARLAVAQDRAEVIRLGCGGMAGLPDIVATYVEVPIVDGVIAAVQRAEGLVRLGLSTSRART